MSCTGCGKHGCECGCGARAGTPLPLRNRPGLPTLRYRAGTYGDFLATMEADLGSAAFPALADLRTREADDPAIALLDAWAVAADVLTFYQERIANEGYLRTATERFSLTELGRLIGYEPRPGVASSLHLAYTLDDTADPVTIPAGARAQSVPGPGEKMQSFETSDDLLARSDWNRLEPRRAKLEQIPPESALTRDTLVLAGAGTRLAPGDRLLFVYGDGAGEQIVRRVQATEPDFAPGHDRLRVTLESAAPLDLPKAEKILEIRRVLRERPKAATDGLRVAAAVDTYFVGGTLADLTAALGKVSNGGEKEAKAILEVLKTPSGSGPPPPAASKLTDILGPLGRPVPPAQLPRLSATALLGPVGDAVPQLLGRFAPQLRDVLYHAWRNLVVSDTRPTLRGLYVLRVSAPLFGYNAPPPPTPPGPIDVIRAKGAARDPDATVHLDSVYAGILADSPSAESWALVAVVVDDQVPERRAARVVSATTVMHTETPEVADPTNANRKIPIKLTATCTRLDLLYAPASLDDVLPDTPADGTIVLTQSEALTLAATPDDTEIGGDTIELSYLYDGLAPERWIIITGERRDVVADTPGAVPVTGIQGGEAALLAGVEQAHDPDVPGDKTHTTLRLAAPLAYRYARDTVTIYGNVVPATHGETRTEVLGSGDARKAIQRFPLKQPPLTYVAAATPSGVASTLEVRVNDVRWHETAQPAFAPPDARVYGVRHDEDGTVTTVFGGRSARLPTGTENVRARYRSGIGQEGNVKAAQVSVLATKPAGVRDVVNPLRAAGGADRDTAEQIRRNAPIAVMALDRLVSVQDYADFARAFAGVGHAAARRLNNGRRELVHVTVAGSGDAPIDLASDLYRVLGESLRRYGDPQLPIRVAARELVALVIGATVALDPDYEWKSVEPKLRAALLARFAFERRALGQRAYLSEAVATLQAVPGVAYVDVDVFDGVSETEARDPALLATHLAALAAGGKPGVFVPARLARFPLVAGGDPLPAQLAYLVPDVRETLVLNPR